jgi:hypothetical protein
MGGFDSFTLAVLGSAALILLIFGVMLVVDKGRDPSRAPAPPPPANAPRKVAGKR